MPRRSTRSGGGGRKQKKTSSHSDSPRPRDISLSTSGNISASTSKIAKTSRRKRNKNDDNSFRERTVSAKTASHWKPISKASEALLVQTIDSAIMSVLSQTSSVSYSDVQDVLNSLKRRIIDKSKNLKAPETKRPKFSTIETACHQLEREALEASKQEEQLSEMVEEMTRTVQEKEKILEELEKKMAKKNTQKDNPETTNLFPLLPADFEEQLGIPPLPKTRAQHQQHAVSLKKKKKENAEVNKLLSTFHSNKGLTSIKDYMNSLSDVVTFLPEN